MTAPRSAPASASADQLAAALTEVAGLLLATESFQAVMKHLAELTVRAVPGVRTAGITIANGGRVITVASADDLAILLDERQYEMDEGPCLQSMRTGEIVDVPDVTQETRWGDYPEQVAGHGVASIHSSPLIVRSGSVGVLNLYAAGTHAFDERRVRAAAAEMTSVIVVTIAGTLRNYGDLTLTDQLQQALSTRSVIDQAIGIVMAGQHCTADEAFAILRGASQARNIRLRQVAQDLLERTSTGPASGTTRGRPAASRSRA